LLLGRDVSLIDLDDPLLKDLYGDGFLDLPKNKTAQDVCEDFLRELHQYVVVKLEKKVSPEVLQGIPMDFWFTLPVVWSDEALKVFKYTAKAAGFGSRSFDALSMIPELETAALAALDPFIIQTYPNPIQVCPGFSPLI
jgi:hypothetical protein